MDEYCVISPDDDKTGGTFRHAIDVLAEMIRIARSCSG